MATRRWADIRRKYASLGSGELAAAAVFGFIAVAGPYLGFRPPADARALWSGLAPLLLVLVQAGTYWLLARGWVGRAPMPSAVANVYRLFRVVDPVVLAAGLAGIVLWFPSGVDALLAVGVWLFGLVEYVNYFVVRLSYPLVDWFRLVRRWRTPRLVRDLHTAARLS